MPTFLYFHQKLKISWQRAQFSGLRVQFLRHLNEKIDFGTEQSVLRWGDYEGVKCEFLWKATTNDLKTMRYRCYDRFQDATTVCGIRQETTIHPLLPSFRKTAVHVVMLIGLFIVPQATARKIISSIPKIRSSLSISNFHFKEATQTKVEVRKSSLSRRRLCPYIESNFQSFGYPVQKWQNVTFSTYAIRFFSGLMRTSVILFILAYFS